MTERLETGADLQRWSWIGLLAGSSVVFSTVFACATPFVALATLAALHLDRRGAVIAVGAAWIANQAIGYGLLGYPRDANSYGWGLAIGLAALLALMAARAAGSRVARHGLLIALPAAFAASFIAYEGALYASSFVLSSGASAFSLKVVGYILQVNLLGLAALLAIRWIAHAAGLRPLPT